MDETSLRAGDADRQRVTELLQRHYVDGRLRSEELTERLRQATAARTLGELDALLQDLPPLPPAAAPPAAPPTTPEPAAPVESERGWLSDDVRQHALIYGLVMLLLVAIWLITTPGRYFWPIWPMLGWGLAVAIHAVSRHRR